ncbi:hypothetical protein [Streptomyces sp. UG1]|uniref:hypothetical protein n=1 Tax=Streptomyces sp. UG1 TaxID=3417652 RepID=UPI003CF8D355
MQPSQGTGEPPEHARFAAYVDELRRSSPTEEPALIRRILTDPDRTMAESAVTRHLDHRAAAIHVTRDYAEWAEWAETMTAATAGRPFLTNRLREWTLLRAVHLDDPWDPDALTRSSNWLQLKLAGTPAISATALTLLADRGRTKRIRHTARAGLVSPAG